MKTYKVILSPEARAQLDDLRAHIATENSAEVANGYIDRIIKHCNSLSTFPHRGTARDDLRPRMRTIPFKRRTTIAFAVELETVTILAISYGGRDLPHLLTEG